MFDVSDAIDDHSRSSAPEAQGAALPEPMLRGLDEPERAAERARYIAEVFAAHHRPLRSFLSRLLRNEDDIADTVQDVFLRIAQLPDPSRLDLNPRAYLFRTAERLVIDRVRRDTFRQAHLHGTLDDVDVARVRRADVVDRRAAVRRRGDVDLTRVARVVGKGVDGDGVRRLVVAQGERARGERDDDDDDERARAHGHSATRPSSTSGAKRSPTTSQNRARRSASSETAKASSAHSRR